MLVAREYISENIMRCTPDGDIRTHDADKELRKVLEAGISEGYKYYVVDMSKVMRISDHGLGTILSLYSKVKHDGGEMAFVDLRKGVQSFVEFAGLTKVLPIYASDLEALAFLQTHLGQAED